MLYFLRQVPLHLPGGVVYRVDFLVVRPSRHTHVEVGARSDVGHHSRPVFDPGAPVLIDFEDCKGFDTKDSRNKRKQVKAVYGIDVRLVSKARKGRV